MSTDLIQITNLTKRFKQKTVFFELNLSFPKHKITVIYGKSGSGKSTLLKLLGGIEPYQAGMIYFNGQKLPRARKHKATVYRRNHVSFIFQDYGLIQASSIKKNLLIGLAYSKLSHSEKLAKMNEALTEVGLNYPELSFKDKSRHPFWWRTTTCRDRSCTVETRRISFSR